jgi:hypothetical protein
MTDRAVQPEAPTTEAGRRFVHYADNVQRAIHPLPRQPTVPHTCKEPEACDLILEAKQHVLAIEAEARAASQERPQPAECSFAECAEHGGGYCERHDHHSMTDPFGQPFGHSPRDTVTDLEGAAPRLQWAESLLERALYLPSMESEDRDLTLTAIRAFFDESPVAQERPSIDVADLTRLLGETGWYIEDDEGNELAYDVAADWIARLAGGSVASPEPDE